MFLLLQCLQAVFLPSMLVAAVEALNAAVYCTECMRLRKRQAYSRHLPALEAEGIEYRPLGCVDDVGETGCEASGTAFSQAVAPEDARPSWSCFGSAIRCQAAGMYARGVLVF